MTDTRTTAIPLSNIRLDVDNPRYKDGVIMSHRDALLHQIKLYPEKLINLGYDISENGLNPSELLIVLKISGEGPFYKVLEGNRRIVVLLLLQNPLLAPETTKVYKKFVEYSKNKKVKITEVPCVVVENEEEADHWIFLKHTGENEGVGTVKWDSDQAARYGEKHGKKAPGLQIVDFVVNNTKNEELINKLKTAKIRTSMKRLISDPEVRGILGIQIHKGVVISDLKKDEVLKGLEIISDDFASKRKHVKDIYSKDDRERYIRNIKEKPDSSKKSKRPWKLQTLQEVEKIVEKKAKEKKTTDRNVLIPSGCIPVISVPRINNIYVELTRLKIQHYENLCSIALRVFIELSFDKYIEVFHLRQSGRGNPTLEEKWKRIRKDLEDRQVITKRNARAIEREIHKKGSMVKPESLHRYVHSYEIAPAPKDLIIAWDNIHNFMQVLWNEIVDNER